MRAEVSFLSNLRLRIGFFIILGVLTIYMARVVQIQGIDPSSYAEKADAYGIETRVIPASRGEIQDRNGEVLARSIVGRMLVADPLLTKRNAALIAKYLAKSLHGDYFDYLEKLTKPKSRFEYLARRVPSSKAKTIINALSQKQLLGVFAYSDPIRSYPSRDVAANILGWLGAEGAPLGGAELAFNKQLSGVDGKESFEMGAGNRIPLGENSQIAAVNGKTVKLTIDKDVQWFTQRALAQTVRGSRAESGSAVVISSDTGEVLALADYPTFDPAKASKANPEVLGSAALSQVYEPGSVEKVLTLATAIDAGKVTPATQLVVPNRYSVSGEVISDWFEHETLQLTLAGVLAKSSNIGTAMAAKLLAKKQLHNSLTKFGLGKKPNTGLGGETGGILLPWQDWSSVDQATISFGQSVSVSALQMAAAVNTIANHGEYLPPSLLAGEIKTDAGEQVGSAMVKPHQVVSARAANQITQMMEMVVNPEKGTAPSAQIPGYRVAGKTGTAQRVGETCRCYDGSLTVSFGGFAPAEAPKFTVYVVIHKPGKGASGGATGGPLFNKIMTYLLSKYGVAPSGSRPADLPTTWSR